MDIQKFTEAYKQVITESTNDSELRNFIRSIVEEVLFESNIEDIAKELEFLPTRKLAKKYKYIENGKPGDMPAMSYTISDKEQTVTTVTSDGKETTNTASQGDIIMSGPSKENYVIKSAKFPKLYQGKIGETVIPEQNPRMVAHYNGSQEVSFTAPWGEDMILKPGDYLVKEGEGKYYRIAKAEYEQTYNKPGK